jgi:hypothetical protein
MIAPDLEGAIIDAMTVGRGGPAKGSKLRMKILFSLFGVTAPSSARHRRLNETANLVSPIPLKP